MSVTRGWRVSRACRRCARSKHCFSRSRYCRSCKFGADVCGLMALLARFTYRTWSLVPQLLLVCRTFVYCDKVILEGRVRSISTGSASVFTLDGTHRSDAPPRYGSALREL